MKNLKRSFAVACDAPAAPSPDSFLRQGLSHHEKGRWIEAAALYEQALEIAPDSADALNLLGVANMQLGDPHRAVGLLERAVRQAPGYGQAFSNLGNAYAARGDAASAIEAHRRAVELDGESPESRYNLGNVLFAVDRCAEALAEFQTAYRLNPRHLAARFNAASVLSAMDRDEEAVGLYRELARVAPDFRDVWTNLGIALAALGRIEEAIETLVAETRLRPHASEAWNNLGCAFVRAERFEEAVRAHREAVRLAPQDIGALLNLSRALQYGGASEAVTAAERASRLAPGNPDAWTVLGDAHLKLEFPHRALSAYRRALALEPECLTETLNLGLACLNADKHDEAQRFFEEYLTRRPLDHDAWYNLAIVHCTAGSLEPCFEYYRKALAIESDSPEMHSSFLVTMNYSAETTPATMLAEARTWAETHAPTEPRFPEPLTRTHRGLRIGYVSGDFREHPVGRFVDGVFAEHDRSSFEVFAYYNYGQRDQVTGRVRSRVDHWRNVGDLSDEELAARVREDGIDILIDMNGHMPLNRLSAFARRMAPVQATWLGYFGTTGIENMDFILTDRILLPEADERFYTERPAHLSGGLYYHRLPDLNLVPNALPMLSRGYATFGCHNLVAKVNPESIALWAEVLHALPDARMILNRHPFQTASIRERCYGRFEEQGIARERIDLVATMTREDYLRSYHEVDVMLDTIPYGAATTSYDALWMGVPIVSLSSDRFAGRMTESILDTAGLSELVPRDREEFVRLALDLATNTSRLADLRATLRSTIAFSRLCDAEAYTRGLESTFEWMWENRRSIRQQG